MYLKSFGNNLRRIRKDQNISMESLAFGTEIDYRQIGRIERGEINTSILSLLRISEFLKTDMNIFFLF
jgi:transcriptional regulator with XRE-family HTH domain